ncbi:MAG TPA: tripartite tricarboxylate transporter substrate binding protein [Noviherbaspirillum sp.]
MKFRSLCLALLLGATSLAAHAQSWPTKPIRFLVAAPGGSSLDVIARTLSDKLKDKLGQPLVVENVPGAAGTIATAQTARAEPDGHTILISFNGPLAFAHHLSKLSYDPQKDLTPVILTSSQPNVLAVSTQVPANNVRELIAYAKQHPGKLNYSSVGNGSSSHLTMELFKSMTGTFMVHIPYNGAPPAALSLVRGDAQVLFTIPTVVMPHVKNGKMKALAVTSAKRFSLLPDLPTVAESGLPGFESLAWNGILVPAGTPREIVERLNHEVDAALKQADVKARLNNAGLEVAGGSPEAFKTLIEEESKMWAEVIRKTGAKLD